MAAIIGVKDIVYRLSTIFLCQFRYEGDRPVALYQLPATILTNLKFHLFKLNGHSGLLKKLLFSCGNDISYVRGPSHSV